MGLVYMSERGIIIFAEEWIGNCSVFGIFNSFLALDASLWDLFL